MDEKKKENEFQDDIELTNEDNGIEPDLESVEEHTHDKIKKLRDKLKACEAEKMQYLEDLQRTKADFLNSKKRLEEERARDKERAVNAQIEKLLPLADSFHMAMHNKEVWEVIDPVWRKGIEGIHSQLHAILDSYSVSETHPIGAIFDPTQHEAMGNVPVESKKENETIVQVIQNGFVRKVGEQEILIRPARVIVGIYSKN